MAVFYELRSIWNQLVHLSAYMLGCGHWWLARGTQCGSVCRTTKRSLLKAFSSLCNPQTMWTGSGKGGAFKQVSRLQMVSNGMKTHRGMTLQSTWSHMVAMFGSAFQVNLNSRHWNSLHFSDLMNLDISLEPSLDISLQPSLDISLKPSLEPSLYLELSVALLLHLELCLRWPSLELRLKLFVIAAAAEAAAEDGRQTDKQMVRHERRCGKQVVTTQQQVFVPVMVVVAGHVTRAHLAPLTLELCMAWLVLASPGSSWFLLASFFSSCCVMLSAGLSWLLSSLLLLLAPTGFSWLLLSPPGSSCFLLTPPGFSLFLLVPSGSSLLFLACDGSTWLLLATPGSPMAPPGLSWLLLASLIPGSSFELRKGAWTGPRFLDMAFWGAL